MTARRRALRVLRVLLRVLELLAALVLLVAGLWLCWYYGTALGDVDRW